MAGRRARARARVQKFLASDCLRSGEQAGPWSTPVRLPTTGGGGRVWWGGHWLGGEPLLLGD